VHGELKFYDYDKTVPGLSTYYVCQDEDGNYYINEDGEEDENELNYIREVNLQDDVIDLSNKVTVAYNDMLAEDEDLVNFILDLNTEIDKNVGEALAKAEGSEQTGDGDTETGEETESEDGSSEEAQAQTTEETQETVSTVTKVRTTDVVNIRKSDSETADKLGKAAEGDEFTLVEEKGNGWSQIEYNGETAYIKSEFLEPVETTEASANTSSDTDTASTTKTDTSSTTKTDTSSSSSSVTGTVTVKENVRVRASASENGEKLGTAYVGDKLDLIMKQADGWTKIKYNGQTAYVKSDYVE
jgi:hypothetical protein